MQDNRRSARTPRFYYDGPLQPDTELTLDKQTSHHLLTVLRAKVDAQLILFNGDGLDVHARILHTGQRGNGKQAVLHLERTEHGIPDSPLHITLVQCVSRPERMDISLRQAVELGVASIIPVYSRHSVKVNDDKRAAKKQQHWQSLVTSACEQSGRSTLPTLAEATTYEQWNNHPIPTDNSHFILSPTASESLLSKARQLATSSEPLRMTLIIGPESGLDADEIDLAVTNGALPVQMGARILRTETAGPACIALLQSILGDLAT